MAAEEELTHENVRTEVLNEVALRAVVSRVMRLSPQSLLMTGRHYYCDLLTPEYHLFVDLGSGSKDIILRQF